MLAIYFSILLLSSNIISIQTFHYNEDISNWNEEESDIRILSNKNISSLSVNDPDDPTILVPGFHTLDVNDTVSHLYYTIPTDTIMDVGDTLGIYLNTSEYLDVDLELSIYDDFKFTGQRIGESNSRGLGLDELFIYQPYRNDDLAQEKIALNITRVEGTGPLELIYISRSGSGGIVEQPDDPVFNQPLDLLNFNFLRLNYSSGAHMKLFLEEREYVNSSTLKFDFNYDLHFTTKQGNWSVVEKSIYNITYDKYGYLHEHDLGYFNHTELGSIIMIAIPNYLSSTNQWFRVDTNVTIPPKEKQNYTEIDISSPIEIEFDMTSEYNLTFETDYQVIGYQIESFGIIANHILSPEPFFNPKYVFSSQVIQSGEVNYYVTQDYGKYYSFVEQQSYHWYFINIKILDIDQNYEGIPKIVISPKVTRNVNQEPQSSDYSKTINLDNQRTYLEIFRINDLPSISSIWVTPDIGLDVELQIYKNSSYSEYTPHFDNSGHGISESTLQIATNDQEIYIVVIIANSGKGNAILNFQRGEDNINPSVSNLDFTNGLTFNYTDPLSINLQADDNSGILNTTIRYRQTSEDTWINAKTSGPTQFFFPYGSWEFELIVFDIAGNSIILDNDTNLFEVHVIDKIGPNIKSINYNGDINEPIEINMLVEDHGSGISTVILEYSYHEITQNMTATINNGWYQVLIPEISVETNISVTVFAIDNDNNWNSSSFSIENSYREYLMFENMTSNSINQTKNHISIGFDVITNGNIENVTLTILYQKSSSHIKYSNYHVEGNHYWFHIFLNNSGNYYYWLNISTQIGNSYLSTNYSIFIEQEQIEKTNTTESMNSETDTDFSPLPDEDSDDLLLSAIILTGIVAGGATVAVILSRKGLLKSPRFLNRLRGNK